jgi:hypothetical protein
MAITDSMRLYRECVRDIWNRYFADTAGWDERCLFLDADVSLFRGIVLSQVGEYERVILPSYRGDREPIDSILVNVLDSADVRVSDEGSFRDTRTLAPETDLTTWRLCFFSLYDFYELGQREFRYVRCAVNLSEHNDSGLPKGVLVPFEQASFSHHPMPITRSEQRARPGYWLP